MNGSSKVTSLLTDLKLRISLEDELSIVFADKQADLSSGTYTIRYVANKKLAYKKRLTSNNLSQKYHNQAT